jgi:uncharacterized membrane protein
VGPGEALNYTVTYKNNGKAACDNANILVTVPSFFNTSDSLEHTFAGLKPGEEKSFNIKGIISSDIPEGNTNLEALAGIATGTKEVELGNNIGKDNTTAYRATSASLNEDKNEAINSGAGDEKLKSSLTITRKVKDKRIHAGDTAIYYIYIQNTGGTDLRDVVVTDNMRLKNTLMGTFSWNIGNMKAGSKYRIRYKLAINELAPAGVYRSTASGYGYDSKGNEVVANKDSQKITILGNTTYDNLAYNNYEYGQNMFQYGDSVITGGICYLDEWPALNEAQAAENPTFLAAADSNPSLPLWIWLAAILAYLLIVNWSLFPKKYFP